MSPNVMSHSRDDLLTRRDALLHELGVDSVEEADERAAAGALASDEWQLLDRLHDVMFLLGEE